MKRFGMYLCCAVLLSAGTVRAQQSQSQQESGDAERASDAREAQKVPARTASRGSGIVADNLDRVAATAEQILEVVNRDTGLMVELKRVIALDAGESGQILEESDLIDSAISERLREDLRTRVLATRLLRKYGYLLPKVNPESDLAQEQKLAFQERAQELARAAERNYQPREQAPAQQLADCESQQADCEFPPRTPPRTRAYSNGEDREALPANQRPEQGDRPAQPAPSSRPDVWRTDTTGAGTSETMLASTTQVYPGGMNSLGNRRGAGGSQEDMGAKTGKELL